MSDFFSKQFFVFLIAGSTAAAINFISRLFYSLFFNFPTAVIFAFLTATVAGYFLFRVFVFQESSTGPLRSAVLFILVAIGSLLQTLFVTLLLAYYLLPALTIDLFREEIAHAFGIMVPAFTSFLFHKYVTFKVEVSAKSLEALPGKIRTAHR